MKTKLLRKVRKRYEYFFNPSGNLVILDNKKKSSDLYFSIAGFISHLNWTEQSSGVAMRKSKQKKERLRKVDYYKAKRAYEIYKL